MRIKSIMCCCGGGVGSSFIVQMNVESLLKKHGIEGVSVDHVSVSEISMHKVDLYVVGSDLAPFLKDKPRVIELETSCPCPSSRRSCLPPSRRHGTNRASKRERARNE